MRFTVDPVRGTRVAPNECRIDDLARISGVTARNIRAYRDSGLLDPPRRQGRSAFYGDDHLAQLQTIADQHRRALLARPLTPVPGGDRT